MSKFIYSDMTRSVFPEVDFAGESPMSEQVVSGLDKSVPSSWSGGSRAASSGECRAEWSGDSGVAEAARCIASVLLLVLIGEGDWGS